MKQERDFLEQKLEEVMNKAKEENDKLTNERNDIERQFFDYKIKSVSGEWITCCFLDHVFFRSRAVL